VVIRDYAPRDPRGRGVRPRQALRRGHRQDAVRREPGHAREGERRARLARRRPQGRRHGRAQEVRDVPRRGAASLRRPAARRPGAFRPAGGRAPAAAGHPPAGRARAWARARWVAVSQRQRRLAGHESRERDRGDAPPARRDLEGRPGQGDRAWRGGVDEPPRLQPEARRADARRGGRAHQGAVQHEALAA
jgi:hypothetical protein